MLTGGEEEASVHVEIFGAVWKRTPDAIVWLGGGFSPEAICLDFSGKMICHRMVKLESTLPGRWWLTEVSRREPLERSIWSNSRDVIPLLP